MIYCVEDDESIRNLMIYTLSASGFEAEGFGDAQSFFAALAQKMPELVLLDIMLPGMDGLQILQKLRSQPETAQIPVILATAKGTEYDRVTGLDLGADDYLSKPFGMMEMVSRIKAVLRRATPKQSNLIACGQLTMDLESHRVTVGGDNVESTYKEFALLRLFLESPGKAFTRNQLLDLVWDMDYMGQSRTVDVHVASLRTKLGGWADRIQTIRGVGYRLAEDMP